MALCSGFRQSAPSVTPNAFPSRTARFDARSSPRCHASAPCSVALSIRANPSSSTSSRAKCAHARVRYRRRPAWFVVGPLQSTLHL
eukprot:1303345-Rhodomonas_salina.1